MASLPEPAMTKMIPTSDNSGGSAHLSPAGLGALGGPRRAQAAAPTHAPPNTQRASCGMESLSRPRLFRQARDFAAALFPVAFSLSLARFNVRIWYHNGLINLCPLARAGWQPQTLLSKPPPAESALGSLPADDSCQFAVPFFYFVLFDVSCESFLLVLVYSYSTPKYFFSSFVP